MFCKPVCLCVCDFVDTYMTLAVWRYGWVSSQKPCSRMQDCWRGQNWHLQNNHGSFNVILCCMLCFTHLYLSSLQPVLVPYVKSDGQCGSRSSSQPCGAAVVVTNGIEPPRGVHYAFGGVQYRGLVGERRTLLDVVLQRQMHNNREETLFSQSAQMWIVLATCE